MAERGLDLLQQTVERLLRRNATANLTRILAKTHPADTAYLIKHLSGRSTHTVFDLLPDTDTAAQVVSELEPAFRIGERLLHVAQQEPLHGATHAVAPLLVGPGIELEPLGSIVVDPKDNVAGYPGSEKRLIWAGMAHVLAGE